MGAQPVWFLISTSSHVPDESMPSTLPESPGWTSQAMADVCSGRLRRKTPLAPCSCRIVTEPAVGVERLWSGVAKTIVAVGPSAAVSWETAQELSQSSRVILNKTIGFLSIALHLEQIFYIRA